MNKNSEHENKFIQFSEDEDNQQQDVNQRNDQAYNSLIDNARRKHDNYWDINHPVVKTILIILFLIALVGSLYYVFLWIQSN